MRKRITFADLVSMQRVMLEVNKKTRIWPTIHYPEYIEPQNLIKIRIEGYFPLPLKKKDDEIIDHNLCRVIAHELMRKGRVTRTGKWSFAEEMRRLREQGKTQTK